MIAEGDPAFDPAGPVAAAVEATRRDVRQRRFPKGWIALEFVLCELQGMGEAVSGAKLDKVTFRRRIDRRSCVRWDAVPG